MVAFVDKEASVNNFRDYESFVLDLERKARADGEGYRRKVVLLAVLGYVFVFGLLILLAAAVIGSIFIVREVISEGGFVSPKAIVGIIGWMMMLATSIAGVVEGLTIPYVHEGSELTPDVAPELFKLLSQLAASRNLPKFDHVMITTDFNACIWQIPKRGLFGPSVNYIEVGIPLMKALTPDQFRAVLGHELGHIAGGDSQLTGWIYRLNRMWTAVHNAMKSRRSGLTQGFIRWYANYFNAYTFPLRRLAEYNADKFAASVAGAETTALALIVVNAEAPYVNSFWQEIESRARFVPEANVRPFSQMFEGDCQPSQVDKDRWLRTAWNAKTGLVDSHPSLADRLGSLGYQGIAVAPDKPLLMPLPLPGRTAETAAQRYLGPWLNKYTDVLDKEWDRSNSDIWRNRFAKAQKQRAKFEGALVEFRAGGLKPLQTRELAEGIREYFPPETGIAMLREMADARPDDPEILIALSRALLEQGDEGGVTVAQHLATLQRSFVAPVNRMLVEFYEAAGDFDKADACQAIAQKNARFDGDTVERVPLTRSDAFVPHDLPYDVIQKLKEHFDRLPNIRAAYIAKRTVGLRPDRPLFVVAIEPEPGLFESKSDIDLDRLAFDVRRGLELPGDVAVETTYGRSGWVKGAVGKVPGSKIFDSRETPPGTGLFETMGISPAVFAGIAVVLLVVIVAVIIVATSTHHSPSTVAGTPAVTPASPPSVAPVAARPPAQPAGSAWNRPATAPGPRNEPMDQQPVVLPPADTDQSAYPTQGADQSTQPNQTSTQPADAQSSYPQQPADGGQTQSAPVDGQSAGDGQNQTTTQSGIDSSQQSGAQQPTDNSQGSQQPPGGQQDNSQGGQQQPNNSQGGQQPPSGYGTPDNGSGQPTQ